MTKSHIQFGISTSRTANVHCLMTPAEAPKWNQDNQRLAIQFDIMVQAKFQRTLC